MIHDDFVSVPGVSYSECRFPNPKTDTAICCLWDSADKVVARRPDAYIVGNCVSPTGVDMLIRTLRANPQIRVLVVRGQDLTGTRALISEALCALMDDLVDLKSGRKEGDVYYLCEREGAVDPMPPSPQVVDLTRRGDPGQRFVGETLWDVWPQLVKQIVEHGTVSDTSYGWRQKELIAPTWTFDAALTLGGVPDWFEAHEAGKSRADLDAYADQSFLNPSEDPAVTYTYGHRLRGLWDDQVARVVKLLKKKPTQRRGLLSTWDPGSRTEFDAASGDVEVSFVPSDIEGGHPPCLTQVWFRLDEDDGSLLAHASFRSHDIFNAGPDNLWGICRLLQLVASELGLVPGRVVATSLSAHIYEYNWEAAAELGRRRGRSSFQQDSRSTLRVRPGGEGVCVDLLNPAGAVSATLTAKKAETVIRKVLTAGWVTTPSHAAWLGRRCIQTEIVLAMRRGISQADLDRLGALSPTILEEL